MLNENPESSIIGEPENYGSHQQLKFEFLEVMFAGEHYLAVSASIDSEYGDGEKVNIANMGQYLIRGSIVIDQKRYLLISNDRKQKCRYSNGHVWEMLTDRELQIAILVSRGKPNKQIAHQLSISEYTVSTYMRRIFSKLGVSSRAAMVACLVESLAGR